MKHLQQEFGGFLANGILRLVACGFFVLACGTRTVFAQSNQESKVAESIDVLNEIMRTAANSIPRALLTNAQAVAIVPRVVKGSFIVGARRGEGVVLIRDAQGKWQAPVFVTLTGGNVGWQVGVQSTDVVLVFKTRTSVEQMLSGTFTIGADAAAAAGPVGRNASVATDEKLQAEVYSYSRSRGLFAGLSIDGSVLKLNQAATNFYYDPTGTGQARQLPDSSLKLVQTLRTYTGELDSDRANPGFAANDSAQFRSLPTDVNDTTEPLRKQLILAAQPLYSLLDSNWQAYLALPAETFVIGRQPTQQQIAETIRHFEAVRAGSQYKQLSDCPEFQNVYELLKQYYATRAKTPEVLNLPSPPSRQNSK